MLECDTDTSVPDWVIEYPETLAIFDEFGIDSSCGGKSLAFACIQRGLDVETVFLAIRDAIEGRSRADGNTDSAVKTDSAVNTDRNITAE